MREEIVKLMSEILATEEIMVETAQGMASALRPLFGSSEEKIREGVDQVLEPFEGDELEHKMKELRSLLIAQQESQQYTKERIDSRLAKPGEQKEPRPFNSAFKRKE